MEKLGNQRYVLNYQKIKESLSKKLNKQFSLFTPCNAIDGINILALPEH